MLEKSVQHIVVPEGSIFVEAESVAWKRIGSKILKAEGAQIE